MSMDYSVLEKPRAAKPKALDEGAPMGRLFASIATLKDSPRPIGAYGLPEFAPSYLSKPAPARD